MTHCCLELGVVAAMILHGSPIFARFFGCHAPWRNNSTEGWIINSQSLMISAPAFGSHREVDIDSLDIMTVWLLYETAGYAPITFATFGME